MAMKQPNPDPPVSQDKQPAPPPAPPNIPIEIPPPMRHVEPAPPEKTLKELLNQLISKIDRLNKLLEDNARERDRKLELRRWGV